MKVTIVWMFTPAITKDAGAVECLYEDVVGDCGGACLIDADADGVCDDIDSCVGNEDAIGACNGDCMTDADNDGICDRRRRLHRDLGCLRGMQWPWRRLRLRL